MLGIDLVWLNIRGGDSTHPKACSGNRLVYYEVRWIHKLFLASILPMNFHKVAFVDNRKHRVNVLEVESDKLMLDLSDR